MAQPVFVATHLQKLLRHGPASLFDLGQPRAHHQRQADVRIFGDLSKLRRPHPDDLARPMTLLCQHSLQGVVNGDVGAGDQQDPLAGRYHVADRGLQQPRLPGPRRSPYQPDARSEAGSVCQLLGGQEPRGRRSLRQRSADFAAGEQVGEAAVGEPGDAVAQRGEQEVRRVPQDPDVRVGRGGELCHPYPQQTSFHRRVHGPKAGLDAVRCRTRQT
ncbi:hypothetical protein OG719_22895 [Microbispora hainanensis]